MPASSNPFIHLNVHSSYSLSEGALSIPNIVDWAQNHAMPALGLMDKNNLFGAFEFSTQCLQYNIMPIIGCTLSFQYYDLKGDLKFLVQNEKGYRQLIHWMHVLYFEKKHPLLTLNDMPIDGEGLIVMTGGVDGILGKLLLAKRWQDARTWLTLLQKTFPNHLYIEVQRHHRLEEQYTEPPLLDLALKFHLPIVATNNTFFLSPDYYQAHDVLLCIGNNTKLMAKDRKKSNPEYFLKSPQDMERLFEDIPEALQNTIIIARRCGFAITPKPPSLPLYPIQEQEKESDFFSNLVWKFFHHLFQNKQDQEEYKKRLQDELDVILHMNYAGYFLIVWDFIKWAKENGVGVGPGRGSGSGSLVAYVLGITKIDPLKFGLIFERFLNPDRLTMPDFDIDFSPESRDKVIAYVQKKYGQDHVCHIITFGTFQARAILRDVGRVMDFPYSVMDQLSKQIHNTPQKIMTLQVAMQQPSFQQIVQQYQLESVVTIAMKLEGLYRHASTHAAGIVISKDPLSSFMPLFRDPKATVATTQFNMKGVEKIGLVKFDFLGLATLTILDTTVEIIQQLYGKHVDIDTIPLDDKKTYELLSNGYTLGVFQLESSGMISVLVSMKPYRFVDIVALISLYRPGPMDNIPEYLARRHGDKPIEYIHPSLKEVLDETYGIPIYQEQVMSMAKIMAGYTMAQADILRSAMGKKIAKQMQGQRKIFIKQAMELHHLEYAFAAKIFDTISSFAGYGFNKSHAVAYAMMSYQTAYFKTHYPLAFMVALLRNDKENTDKLYVIIKDIKRIGISIFPPHINQSEADFFVDKKQEEPCILYGLSSIKGLGNNIAHKIVSIRKTKGVFTNIFDFIEKMHGFLNKRIFEMLLESGALDSIIDNRYDIWNNHSLLLNYMNNDQGSEILFSMHVIRPIILKTEGKFSLIELMQQEKRSLGFYFSYDPLKPYKQDYKKLDAHPIQSFINNVPISSWSTEKTYRTMALISNIKVIKTKQRDSIYLMKLTDMDYDMEITCYNKIYEKFKNIIQIAHPLFFHIKLQSWGKDQDNRRIRWICEAVSYLEHVVPPKKLLDIKITHHDLENLLKVYVKINAQSPLNKLSRKIPYTALLHVYKDTYNPQYTSNLHQEYITYQLGQITLSKEDLEVFRPWL